MYCLFSCLRVSITERQGFLQLHIDDCQIMTKGVVDLPGNADSVLGGGNGLIRVLLKSPVRALQLGKQHLCPYAARLLLPQHAGHGDHEYQQERKRHYATYVAPNDILIAPIQRHLAKGYSHCCGDPHYRACEIRTPRTEVDGANAWEHRIEPNCCSYF